jgi:S-adenosylmethionine hydrolase
MSVITLLTDFGLADEYVGVMKGVIARINPGVTIVDICHHIDPQDIVHGATILASSFDFFPEGAVHVAIVDPGVGGTRRILALDCGRYRFVVPDNGLIEWVMRKVTVTAAVAVENPNFCLASVSQTFHGRDIFAPVAAHLAAGLPMTELGPAVPPESLVSQVVPRCQLAQGQSLIGTVVAVDRFGNLLSNIDAASIAALTRQSAGKSIIVKLGGHRIEKLSTSYDSVAWHAPLAIIGSRDLLEISVNGGNAQQQLNVKKRDDVQVHLEP